MDLKIGQPHWYIVNTMSQQEKATADKIIKTIEALPSNNPCFDKIKQVLVAEQQVEVRTKEGVLKKDKSGNVVKKVKNLYPGYIFVKMLLTKETWYLVRNTEGVTGIAGSGGGGQRPSPVSDEEMEPILKKMGIVESDMYGRYKVGDSVRVIKGDLQGTEAKIVETATKDKPRVKIAATFFGRETEIEVDFADIEKI